MDALIKGLVETGAPWGLLCAALSVAVAALWRRCLRLGEQLYEVSMAQVKRDLEFHHALESARLELVELRRLYGTGR